MMFPGYGAQVYYNDAGEPAGWDYPSCDPPEPRDPADEPYRSDEVIDLWLAMNADEFTAHIAAETAGGCGSVTLPGPLHWKALRAIDRGAEDLVIHTSDGSVWLGTVQDFDTDRGEVTVELR
jgi:hypothetical protein